MKIRIFSTLVLAMGSQAALSVELAQIFDSALANDPTYQGARGTYAASKEVWPQALAQILPTITTSFNTTGTHSGYSSLNGYNITSQQISVAQPIFHFDYWVQLSKANAQTKQVYANYAASLQDLIIRVAQKYFDVLAAEDSLSFQQSQRRTFSRHLEQTQQRFDVGLIAITDVHDAKARHDNAVAKEIAASNQLNTERENLGEITGAVEQVLRQLPVNESVPLLSPDPEQEQAWVDKALESNWAIQSAYQAKRSAQREVWRVRTNGHMPTVDADATIKRSNSTPPLDYSTDTKSMGLTVRFPIFQGGASLSKTREAIGSRTKATADYDKTLKSVMSQTRRSYRGVLSQIASVKSLQQAVLSNEKALDATEAAYEVGTRTIVDVLDAQTNLLSAQRDNAKAQYDYMMELLKLKEASGSLGPEDIQMLSDWLRGKGFNHRQ